MRDVRTGAAGRSGAAPDPGASSSYEEFVATRGPGLFRTAYLLAGEETAAERLLQVGLVRLRLDWRRARRTASVEQHAVQILAETLLSRSSGLAAHPLLSERLVALPPDDEAPAPHDELWARFAGLPDRERVVLVLGQHEGLPDARIAAVLRRLSGVVRATTITALTALAPGPEGDVSVADRLGGVLAEVAGSRTLPGVDADGLARVAAAEGARRRHRRTRTVTLATGGLLAVWLGLRLLGGGQDATPAHPPRHPVALSQLGRGPDTSLPWWEGGELHLGARVLPTNHSQVVAAPGTTLVGDETVEDDRPKAAWWYVTKRGLLPLASSSRALFRPVVSPDGRFVAWAEPVSPTRRRLVLWDVSARRALGSLMVPVRVTCCHQEGAVHLHGIDPAGRVLFDTGGALRSWGPGQVPRRVPALTASLFDAWTYAGGVSWRARSPDPLGPFPIHYGSLDAAGELHSEGTVPPGGVWSPDGRHYAWVSHGEVTDTHQAPDLLLVVDVIRQGQRAMRLPPTGGYQVVAWESPTDVVVAVRRDTGRPLRGSDLPTRVQLLRCHIDSGACETAGVAPWSVLGLTPPS